MAYVVLMETADKRRVRVHCDADSAEAARDYVVEYWLQRGEIAQCLGVSEN